MTNAIYAAVVLSTNWDFTMSWEPVPGLTNRAGTVVHRAEIHRGVGFYTMEGTNKVPCGYSSFIKAGTIYKTNGVLGRLFGISHEAFNHMAMDKATVKAQSQCI